MNIIAQQAAISTAQTMLALSAQGGQNMLPGLQIFAHAAGGAGRSPSTTTPEEQRSMALQNMLQRAEAPQEAPLAIMDGSVAPVAQEVRASNAQLSEAGHVASPAVGGVENGVSTQVAVPPSVVEKSQVTGAAEVEGDLLRLAEMHYEHALPQVLQPQEDSQSVRKGAEMQPPVRAGMKKPAAAKGTCSMKKPAVSVSTQQLNPKHPRLKKINSY